LALTDVLNDRYPWCAAHSERLRVLFDAYVAAKQAQQILDFDVVLLYWAAMMRVPAFAAEVGAIFEHVLVDEYQDTNTIQATIVRLLKPDGRGVTVVGDDAQAIYSFRAATVRNILDFPSQYTPPATVITLDRNYRSTAAILDASNAVISLAKERYTKNLVTERGSGERPRLVTVADDPRRHNLPPNRSCAPRERRGCASRRSCFVRRAIVPSWNSSFPGATFRS
jgi:DNA helicase-2/ATP-dependent DNA helicase PcrA